MRMMFLFFALGLGVSAWGMDPLPPADGTHDAEMVRFRWCVEALDEALLRTPELRTALEYLTGRTLDQLRALRDLEPGQRYPGETLRQWVERELRVRGWTIADLRGISGIGPSNFAHIQGLLAGTTSDDVFPSGIVTTLQLHFIAHIPQSWAVTSPAVFRSRPIGMLRYYGIGLLVVKSLEKVGMRTFDELASGTLVDLYTVIEQAQALALRENAGANTRPFADAPNRIQALLRRNGIELPRGDTP